MDKDRFNRDKATIRAELERRARARQTITYAEASAMVGRAIQGLGKILDAIKAEELAERRPDLGSLVVATRTGFPSYVEPSNNARAQGIAVREAVFGAWEE